MPETPDSVIHSDKIQHPKNQSVHWETTCSDEWDESVSGRELLLFLLR